MSKELLTHVGEVLYGDQWQALLARDLSVNDRSMRRWAAGTDQIPEGIWRDICIILDGMLGKLKYLAAEVKERAGLVEVHSFRVFDAHRGEMVQPRMKSTAARIAMISGDIIPDTSEWVPPTLLDQEGRMREPNDGLQTQVYPQPKPR